MTRSGRRDLIGTGLVVLTFAVGAWVYSTTRAYNAQACARSRAIDSFLISDAGVRAGDAVHARSAARLWSRLAATGPPSLRSTAAELARLRRADAGRSARTAALWRSLARGDLRGCSQK